ncbi:MAG: hypothetical protein KDJ97_27620 [Anaerolineae bacterium]|nr:hypothetical protein [Anaerolineae bacterium]
MQNQFNTTNPSERIDERHKTPLTALLYHNKKRHRPDLAVALARREFESAGHCRGRQPAAAVFPPSQRPDETELAGLPVHVADNVPINHIRIIAQETNHAH